MEFSSDKVAEEFYNEVEKRFNEKLAKDFSPEEVEEFSLMDKEFLKQVIINDLRKEGAGAILAKYKYNKNTGKYELCKKGER